MAQYWYVASNGRCGTRYLARALSAVPGRMRVAHEPLAELFASRHVFRDPDALYLSLGKSQRLQRYFFQQENFIAKGGRVANLGWPCFAWLRYFAERFGEAFRHVHLVRNPYVNAASHTTHFNMLGDAQEVLALCAKVYGSDACIVHTRFRDRYDGFGTFERQLLHWLEVTRWLEECRNVPGFEGLIRFEDLFGTPGAVNALAAKIAGRAVGQVPADPFDRVHVGRLLVPFKLDPELRELVDAQAMRLGYSADDLSVADDLEALRARYQAKRHAALTYDVSQSVKV